MRNWQLYQRERLALEARLLRIHMPDFPIYQPQGWTNVSGYWTSNSGSQYLIRIVIPDGYPDECPSTYVEQPAPLLDHFGMPMTRHGDSHEFHTWKPDREGIVKICTFKPAFWDASNTLNQMVQKAFLWIIAYEHHRKTGTKISDVLLDMHSR